VNSIPPVNRRFLVDVDEVLADLRGPVLKTMTEVTGVQYKLSDFSGWDYFEILTEKEKEKVFSLMNVEGYCASLEVHPGAQDAIEKLRSMVSVIVVTGLHPGPFWIKERDYWLKKNFGFDPRREVIYTQAKYAVAGRWFLEDRPSQVIEWAYGNPCNVPMLWDTENTHGMGYDHLRVYSWEEVIAKVQAGL
jgi:5'(3')-deoxyribonucleotidase